jgi:DNA-binding NarL/FixJ family response regulator
MIGAVRRSVLVVDDDPAFRTAAHRVLAVHGLRVVGEAGSAAEGAAAALELEPEGVLVDVGLPDEDGVALARRLVALPWSPRVLLTSSDPDAVGADASALAGTAGFLPKQDLPDAPLGRLLCFE